MIKEWEHEPDRLEFEYDGFQCLILRCPESKHLNGYVGLPKWHPYYGRNYDDMDVDVHGGLTFSQEGDGGNWASGSWWIGFDCAHYGDLIPQWLLMIGRKARADETYRNIEYVKGELMCLVKQLTPTGILQRGLERG